MKVKISRDVDRFFNIVLGALAMMVVALVSAFITMRLAIHGHEVKVPNLTGLTLADASRQTSSLGLTLKLENRFYSANVPPGQILAQYPAPGAVVRREWPVRVTESLGTQQVAIPAVLGQSERTAASTSAASHSSPASSPIFPSQANPASSSLRLPAPTPQASIVHASAFCSATQKRAPLPPPG